MFVILGVIALTSVLEFDISFIKKGELSELNIFLLLKLNFKINCPV